MLKGDLRVSFIFKEVSRVDRGWDYLFHRVDHCTEEWQLIDDSISAAVSRASAQISKILAKASEGPR
jgi:hypothetical protein